jgi:hypothetical protein
LPGALAKLLNPLATSEAGDWRVEKYRNQIRQLSESGNSEPFSIWEDHAARSTWDELRSVETGVTRLLSCLPVN